MHSPRPRVVRIRRRSAAVLFILLTSTKSSAQAPATITPPASGAVLKTRDIALLSGATVLSALVSRYDTPIASALTDTAMQARHRGFTTAAKRASLATETVLMIAGSTVWGIERLRHDDEGAAVALHTTEAVASGALVIQIVRGALGRARPYVVDEQGQRRDGDPYDFQFLHGFTSFNYRSFPSMHAMASMAVASALAQEMRFRDTPHRRIYTPILYSAAVLPALSRMYLDEHWASDIAMGMFLGVLAGQKVVMYSRDHPDNRIDRTFLKPSLRATVIRDAGGVSFHFSPF